MRLLLFSLLFLLGPIFTYGQSYDVEGSDVREEVNLREIFTSNKNITESVVIWTKTRPKGSRSNNVKCEKPKEDGKIFHDCLPGSRPREYPNPKSSCRCVQCPRIATLECASDKKWYPKEPQICNNCSTKAVCTSSSAILPSGIKCSSSSEHVPTCYCKSTCVKVDLICSHRGWDVMNKEQIVLDKFTRHEDSLHLTIYVNNGVWQYECDEGYMLIGEKMAQCDNGKPIGELPMCIAIPGETSSINRSDNVSVFQMLIIVIITMLITALVILLIIKIKRSCNNGSKRHPIASFRNKNNEPLVELKKLETEEDTYEEIKNMNVYQTVHTKKQGEMKGQDNLGCKDIESGETKMASVPLKNGFEETVVYDDVGPMQKETKFAKEIRSEENPVYDDVALTKTDSSPVGTENLYDCVGLEGSTKTPAPNGGTEESVVYDDVGLTTKTITDSFPVGTDNLYDDVGPKESSKTSLNAGTEDLYDNVTVNGSSKTPAQSTGTKNLYDNFRLGQGKSKIIDSENRGSYVEVRPMSMNGVYQNTGTEVEPTLYDEIGPMKAKNIQV